jgi:integrase
MSPKPRKAENKSLPARWRHKHGAFYYRVPPGQEHLWDGKTEYRLGKTQPEAYRVWATRIEYYADARTIRELLERYAVEVIPHKAPKTQESNLISIRKLIPVFGHMPIPDLKPQHVFKYRDLRSKQGVTAANHDIEVLSHAYTKAIEWGLTENHPIKGKVGKLPTKPRDRYVEDWELGEALKVASPFIDAYINLKLLIGLRRGDLLSIRLEDLKEDGIHVQPRKTQHTTGKKIIYVWIPELREAIDNIKALPKRIGSLWLFSTRTGKPYICENGTANSFDSVWQRFMAKALKDTGLKERFTEHDLRAKVASDTETEHARQLLGHSSSSITERVYRRKAEKVTPAVRGGK